MASFIFLLKTTQQDEHSKIWFTQIEAQDMIFQSLHTFLQKKNKRKPKLIVTDSWVPEVNGPHSSVKQRQGTAVDQRYLTVGEVSGSRVTMVVFLSSSHVDGW